MEIYEDKLPLEIKYHLRYLPHIGCAKYKHHFWGKPLGNF
jgi:hypothetical protein